MLKLGWTSHRNPRGSHDPHRRHRRSLLRRARGGDDAAFGELAGLYLDLTCEVLYLNGFTSQTDRLRYAEMILLRLWKFLPYTRRLSDFERFLALHLQQHRAPLRNRLADDNHRLLAKLHPAQKFLIVAREFDNWTHRALRFALHASCADIRESLLKVRCHLLRVNFELLPTHEKRLLRALNLDLEGALSSRASRRLQKSLAAAEPIRRFKADWLTRRCELIELRQDMRLPADLQLSFLHQLRSRLRHQPMVRPGWITSLVTHLTFARLPQQALGGQRV
ncbi:MAG: hypothetical protein EA425_08050 [Puniceicoccaceae bacterium]|nr:MAG: hypothetical protein EA425_08050 [Puniceicoccaceae bacterium]